MMWFLLLRYHLFSISTQKQIQWPRNKDTCILVYKWTDTAAVPFILLTSCSFIFILSQVDNAIVCFYIFFVWLVVCWFLFILGQALLSLVKRCCLNLTWIQQKNFKGKTPLNVCNSFNVLICIPDNHQVLFLYLTKWIWFSF